MSMPAAAPPRGAPEDWRILLALALYRSLLLVLLLSLDQSGYGTNLFSGMLAQRFHWTTLAYAGASMVLLVLVLYRTPRIELQAHIHFATDVIAVGSLMYTTGGVSAGFGVLLMLPAMGCALLLSLRMAMVQAAAATLAIFSEEIIRQSGIGYQASEFTRVGLLGLMFFATSAVGSYVSSRARRSEQLAERVGSEFADLSRVNDTIIETLSTGVVVIDGERRIRTINAAATQLLGLRQPLGQRLPEAVAPLNLALEQWLGGEHRDAESLPMQLPAAEVLPRFTRLGFAAQAPIMIMLEDASKLRAQAQQMKLAALGRLSASIAHEIRNPLSAITHAGQLLAESPEIGGENQRLLAMIQRHGTRIDKIVRDVLELSRRDATQRETLALRPWLTRATALYQEGYTSRPRPLELGDVPADLTVRFSPGHLQQVLFNLWDNSFEHAPRTLDTVVLLTAGVNVIGQVYLETTDNGAGIPPELQERVFEPFFTTSTRGTGLGLYLARELCEYNQARLSHVPQERGACFRITFAREN